jgi:hypothetical protein
MNGQSHVAETRGRARWWLAAALSIAAALSSSEARADGLVVDAARLPSADRARLDSEIRAARRARPGVFDAARRVAAHAGDADAHKHGRLAPLSLRFQTLGPQALPALLHLAAFERGAPPPLSASARVALRAGLVEAIGAARDPLARPVLLAVLDGADTEPHLVRAAAAALGKLGEDTDAAKLVALARAPGPKQLAVLAGIGHCRRTLVARALAELLASRPAPETARVAADALGDLGSAWAWKTPALAPSPEQAEVRATAARALVDVVASYPDPVRAAASDALMVVDDPCTAGLLEQARRTARPELATEIDRLALRFARNPTR